MPFPILRISALAVLATAAGCAQQPVQPASSVPAASSMAMASAPAQGSPKGNSYGISTQLLQMARDDGYRPTMRDGKAFFCRRHIPTGSTLPRTQCVDSTGLRFEIQREQQERQALYQQAPIVGQPSGQ